MNNSELAHRWVHGLLGRNGELNGSNMHANNVNLYSYSTVIAQCLDRVHNVFIVIDKNLSISTSKHIGHVNAAFPAYCTVIRTHFNGGGYGYYDNAELLDPGDVFDKEKRLRLVGHFLENLRSQYANVLTGKTLSTEKIAKQHISNIKTLDIIYGENLLEEWVARIEALSCKNELQWKQLLTIARMILDRRSDADITNALFGVGTWEAMQKRISPLKKAAETRRKAKQEAHTREMERMELYFSMTDEDVRKAWRNHDTRIPNRRINSDVCYGGNVLLRFSKNGQKIETSKGVSMTIDEALRCWKIIKRWHEQGTFLKDTILNGYRAISFDGNLLVAGCHTVAYCEMERMYKAICEREAA